MQIHIDLRISMLFQLKESITTGFTPLEIKFYDVNSALLCSINYAGLDVYNTGNNAGYKFRHTDGAYVLRGAVTTEGTASSFSIKGNSPSDVLIDNMIYGSVGATNTLADIRFNTVRWSENANITLSDLTLSMPQGV